MIIDHIGLFVKDYAASKAFYQAAFAPLNIVLSKEYENYGGFGYGQKPEFWIGSGGTVHLPMHVAFIAESRAAVDAFYVAAIKAGGTDNGKPGIREHYHADYYGAFVIDPDGHNIEAVCHKPE